MGLWTSYPAPVISSCLIDSLPTQWRRVWEEDLSQILGSRVEHASSAFLATMPLGYKLGVGGRAPKATELESPCPDLCPIWPGFKPILSLHRPQMYREVQAIEMEGPFTLSLQSSSVPPLVPMNTQPSGTETCLQDACLWPCCTHSHYSCGRTHIFHSILLLILS